jgi:hypothetical protein
MRPKGQEFVMVNKDRRARDLFPEFDFLGAFFALFFGSRLELKPIPIKARRR